MTHPKRPRDPNQLAKSIIDIATGEKPEVAPSEREGSLTHGLSPWAWLPPKSRHARGMFALKGAQVETVRPREQGLLPSE